MVHCCEFKDWAILFRLIRSISSLREELRRDSTGMRPKNDNTVTTSTKNTGNTNNRHRSSSFIMAFLRVENQMGSRRVWGKKASVRRPAPALPHLDSRSSTLSWSYLVQPPKRTLLTCAVAPERCSADMWNTVPASPRHPRNALDAQYTSKLCRFPRCTFSPLHQKS